LFFSRPNKKMGGDRGVWGVLGEAEQGVPVRGGKPTVIRRASDTLFILYSLFFILYSLFFILYSLFFILYSFFFIL